MMTLVPSAAQDGNDDRVNMSIEMLDSLITFAHDNCSATEEIKGDLSWMVATNLLLMIW